MLPQVAGAKEIVPSVVVRVNGLPLGRLGMGAPIDAKEDLIAVTIAEDLEVPSMFTLKLKNWDLDQGKVTWVDSDQLGLGSAVEIGLSYDQSAAIQFWGEITGLEPEFTEDTASVLIVRGYDRRHRLMRGKKTKSFTKMKDSAIASQIASSASLMGKVTDTKTNLEYVLQHNQTDLEFLQDRARRIGYEVVVENKTLFFRPYQHRTGKVVTLTRGENLLSFSPRLSSMNQVSAVEVRGWDPKQKKPVIGKIQSNAQPSPIMGGSSNGFKATSAAFGQQASQVVVTEPVSSLEEAKQIAQAQFDAMALGYITGDGECRGNPKIRAGRVIAIEGVGKRFSGLYYVTAATHTYAKGEGYLTQFTVRRTST